MKLLSTNLSRLDGALPSFAVPCEEPRTTGESVIRNSDLPQWLIPNLYWAVTYQDGKGNKGRIPNWEDKISVFFASVFAVPQRELKIFARDGRRSSRPRRPLCASISVGWFRPRAPSCQQNNFEGCDSVFGNINQIINARFRYE